MCDFAVLFFCLSRKIGGARRGDANGDKLPVKRAVLRTAFEKDQNVAARAAEIKSVFVRFFALA